MRDTRRDHLVWRPTRYGTLWPEAVQRAVIEWCHRQGIEAERYARTGFQIVRETPGGPLVAVLQEFHRGDHGERCQIDGEEGWAKREVRIPVTALPVLGQVIE